ncbi:ribosomal protein S18 [Xylariomycetidae sp. FL2044]|nr:ribosomal protein S18 [Xylariomycetidae sp. FL2044]
MPPRIPFLRAIQRSPIPVPATKPLSISRTQQTAPLSTSRPALALKQVNQAASLLEAAADSAKPQNSSSTRAAGGMYAALARTTAEGASRGTAEGNEKLARELRAQGNDEDYTRQMTRQWRRGDVYAPHDLSAVEMKKWRRNQARKRDLIDMMGISPLDMYRNFSFISEFMTSHGRIKHSADTGLRPPNQRKLAKAIRRAIGLGIHPSVHRHPEILMRSFNKMYAQNQPTVNKDLRI